jgi:hypothetical protein
MVSRNWIIKGIVVRAAAFSHSGAPLIVAGITALMTVAAFPTAPAVTALSIVMLGATNTTLDRYRHSQALTAALLLHTGAYASLYVLFVGATLHAAAATPSGALSTLPAVDLVTSAIPLAISVHRIVATFRQQLELQR